MWISLIDSEFWAESQLCYSQLQENPPTSQLPAYEIQLQSDCAKAFLGPLASLASPAREEALPRLLNLFTRKRADIGYVSGMSHILALLLHVYQSEADAFGVFCHVVERVFPVSYFSKADRDLGKHTEFRTFALLAERLRPRMVQTLRAVFHPHGKLVRPT